MYVAATSEISCQHAAVCYVLFFTGLSAGGVVEIAAVLEIRHFLLARRLDASPIEKEHGWVLRRRRASTDTVQCGAVKKKHWHEQQGEDSHRWPP